MIVLDAGVDRQRGQFLFPLCLPEPSSRNRGAIQGTGIREHQRMRRLDRQKPAKEKKKMRGRSKIGKKLKKKHRNIIDAERAKFRAAQEAASAPAPSTGVVSSNGAAPLAMPALSRFVATPNSARAQAEAARRKGPN